MGMRMDSLTHQNQGVAGKVGVKLRTASLLNRAAEPFHHAGELSVHAVGLSHRDDGSFIRVDKSSLQTHSLLKAGKPEPCHYRAVCVLNNEKVQNFSDEVIVNRQL